MKTRHLALLALLPCAPAARAQPWLVNSAINKQIVETAICDSALREHERLPDVCAKYPRYGGKVTRDGGAAPGQPVSPTAMLFTPVATAPTTGVAPANGSRLADGHYDCLILSMTVGASFSTQYQPTGMSFAIAGHAYSDNAGGGTVAVSPDVVAFHGGAYDGWKGARLNGAIVFRKNGHSNPQAGDGIRAGDFRCARTSG
jgi:hypothetical protein